MKSKICGKCRIEKVIDEFYKHKCHKDGYDSVCKECDKRIKTIKGEYKNRICIICNCEFIRKKYSKKYDSMCQKCGYKYSARKSYIKNKEKYRSNQKEYYARHKKDIYERHKKYEFVHKQKMRIYRSNYRKRKCGKEPSYKLRLTISRSINRYLKLNNSSKNGNPAWLELPYTPQQLKEHLESQFEPWMNWKNHGPVRLDHKTWQIDHIVPQSALPYSSMDDENFQKCWALENLRPLEALENLRKSNKILKGEQLIS